MGIQNIHILYEDTSLALEQQSRDQEYIAARRVIEHRAGRHPSGEKRRDCPLCRAGK